MIVKFNIVNLEIDFTDRLSNSRKEWWFNNCFPKIPVETKIEDLTDNQKVSLIKLAMYEGYLDQEVLCNMSSYFFTINN